MFEPFLTSFVASLHALNNSTRAALPQSWNFEKAFEGWDKLFDKVLRGLEDRDSQVRDELISFGYYAETVTGSKDESAACTTSGGVNGVFYRGGHGCVSSRLCKLFGLFTSNLQSLLSLLRVPLTEKR